MAFLDDVGAYLAAGGYGTLGTDLFLGMLPESPDSAVTLMSYGGKADEYGGPGPSYLAYPRLQVMCRGFDPPTVVALAENIRNLLAAVDISTPMNGNVYHYGRPLHDVIAVGRDGNQRYLYACNFEFMRAL